MACCQALFGTVSKGDLVLSVVNEYLKQQLKGEKEKKRHDAVVESVSVSVSFYLFHISILACPLRLRSDPHQG